ncbi:UPF0193 protein EVG1 [Trichomycterus rosablanca]|uniref:UPF0193 protein EVG1 n=1 Tax=Trichomycterus rosablanca TaxID=2290929 RepID=UPI002F356D58
MERMQCGTTDVSSGSRGLWNCPRGTKYSKETQQLIQLMMRESRLTSFQQRQINSQLKKGGTLPLTCNPTSSTPAAQPVLRPCKPPTILSVPQRRSAEKCSAGDNYTRERFRPSATRDLEKEKCRLQNILATGQEVIQPSPSHTQHAERREDMEIDRFQEVLDEIEERRQFLEEMTALGRGNHYHHMINTEISQKIRELELIDKARSDVVRTFLIEKQNDHEQQ